MAGFATVGSSHSPVRQCLAGRWWVCAVLGAVLLGAGVFIFFDVMVASLVAATLFAVALIVAGLFQIVHAFSARGWGSLTLSLVVGLLCVLGGVVLAFNPLATSLGLTLAIAALLIASGAIRLTLSFRHWRDFGWILFASALLSIITGMVLLMGFPWSGLVVPGILLGIDLIIHGAWWLALGLLTRQPDGRTHDAGRLSSRRTP
jgi:uncharacterized membrane protein HdeD (DUF308 family)